MKINLEFERADLEKMISRYFYDAGFAVQNMEELCTAFEKAFPSGLVVQAEIAYVPAKHAPPPAPIVVPAPASVSDDAAVHVVALEEASPSEEPRLSHADLLDPTNVAPRPLVRTKEEDVQDVAEIRRLRRESLQYEQQRNRTR